MLDELGYEVIKASSEVEPATAAARSENVQLAVLDLAIEDGSTFPVAAALRERGVPFIFVTGLDISKAREKFGTTVVLQKPFGADALNNALRTVASAGQMPP
jgi:DNA-binding response OmpR family regulator